MRLTTFALIGCLLTTSACGSYERVSGGAFVGGVTGGLAGAMCCGDPGRDVGPGIIVGIVVGALVGWTIDQMRSD